jgi:hypothetical protein
LIALALGFLLFAGACAQAGDVPSASGEAAAKPVKKAPTKAKVPHWVIAGFAAADRELALRTPLEKPDLSATSNKNKLPSRPEFIALMMAAGINKQSSACIYDNISSSPSASQSTAQLLNAITEAPKNGRTVAGGDVLGQLDQGKIQQFLVAIAPCMDGPTLIALLLTLGGKDTAGANGLDSRLAGLTYAQIAAVAAAAGPHPSLEGLETAATAVGVGLTSPQIAMLESVLAGAGGALNALNPKNTDLTKVDTTKLGPEGVAQLLFAVAAGLTDSQRQQLIRVANVNLSKLHVNVDPNKITTQQGGALLVLLLPFLSANVAPSQGGPPPGSDPSQIYIPPGTDLSQINPLNFASREDVVAGLGAQGVLPSVANCLYDKLRAIDPRLIGLSITGNNLQGGSEILLAAVGCIVSN